MKEERLTKSNVASFQPQYSPDGKEIAFLENRTAIRVINLKAKLYVLLWMPNTSILMQTVTNGSNGVPTVNGFSLILLV